jgi:hypothetical protein
VSTQVGGFFTVNKPTSEANIYNLEMQSDLKASQDLLALTLREIWQSARLVDPQSVKDAVGQLTNFGLKVLYQDALTKVQTKRQLYEEGLSLVIKQSLELAGMKVPETVNITWPDVLPEDPNEVSTALLKELEAKIISVHSYREIRGYSQEKEEERLAEEQAGEQNLGQRLLTDFVRGQELPA